MQIAVYFVFYWKSLYKQVIISLTLLNFIFNLELAIFYWYVKLFFKNPQHSTLTKWNLVEHIIEPIPLQIIFKAQVIWIDRVGNWLIVNKNCMKSMQWFKVCKFSFGKELFVSIFHGTITYSYIARPNNQSVQRSWPAPPPPTSTPQLFNLFISPPYFI